MSGQNAAPWRALEEELGIWAHAGRRARFWWRDDDAGALTPALARLLALATRLRVPLAIAAVPARLTDDAASRLKATSGLEILQHGYRHENHEPPSDKKAEFGDTRTAADALADLAAGRRALQKCGVSALPVLVPPWNRVSAALVEKLPAAGFGGLSTYQARKTAQPAPGLCQINTHIDVIDWRGGRGFVGLDTALALAVDHLKARRLGHADTDEPTGLLSHHAVHDEAAWDFIAAFLRATKDHPAALWPPVADLFIGAGGAHRRERVRKPENDPCQPP